MKDRFKTTLLGLTLVGAFTTSAIAQNGFNWDERFRYNPSAGNFEDQELRFDLFGMYGTRNRDDFTGDSTGIGLGVNYFFTKYLGVGADTYLDDFDFPNHLDASLLARYPIEQFPVAPYAMVGLGRQFHDVSQWTTHIGGGAEFRMNRNTGFFLDVRRVFADQTRDFNVWRLGVRFGF